MAVGDMTAPSVKIGDIEIPREWVCEEYSARAPSWRLFELCCRGGDEFIRSTNPVTLFSHPREPGPSYAERRRRAAYRNHCGAIVGLKADAIFQPQVSRAQKDDLDFSAFLSDVDLRGTNADPWWNETARWALTYGRVWVGIAMSAAPGVEAAAMQEGRAVSLAEFRASNVRPYLWRASPLSVVDWRENDEGRLEYAVVISRSTVRTPLAGPNEKARSVVYATVYLPDREIRYEVKARGQKVMIHNRPHPFGRVPLVPISMPSQLEDLARLGLAVFNYDSLVDEQIYRQTFNQLVGKVKDKTEFQSTVAGTDTVILVNPDESLEYLAPNVQTIQAIRERAWETVDEMWSMAHLRSRPGGKGSQPATETSGVAYAFEHKEAETDLANIAVRLEESELQIMRMRAVALGLDPAGLVIHYPREFDIRALLARANEAQILLNVNVGTTAAAEIRKALARKALPRATAEMLTAIDAEIEAIADEPIAGPTDQPPDQSMQPPGAGSQADRTTQFKDAEVDQEDADDAA